MASALIASSPVVLFTWESCPFCIRAVKLLSALTPSYKNISVDEDTPGEALFPDVIKLAGGHDTVPAIFINGKFVGGFSDIDKLNREGRLRELIAASGATLLA